MDRMRHGIGTVAFFVGLLLLTACGGGGGGGVSATPRLTGLYNHASAMAVASIPTGGSAWGLLSSAGAGFCTLQANDNVDGSVHYDTTGETRAYTVDDAGVWRMLGSDGVAGVQGGLSADNRTSTFAAVREGSPPFIGAMVRPEGTYSAAAAAGSYHCVHWIYAPASEAYAAGRGYASLESDGTWSITGRQRTDAGWVAFSDSGIFTLGADGHVTLGGAPGQFTGGAAPDLDLIVTAGHRLDGGLPGARWLVRRGSGGARGTFAGTYHVVSLAVAGGMTISAWGTCTSDGEGGWSMLLEGKVDTALVPAATRSGTYDVLGDGFLEITFDGGGQLQGGVSPSGNHAVAAGASGASGGPQVWLFVRQ